MDPIYPWLDPIEVRRLADRLMKPTREPSVLVTEAGFDDGFVGFATGQSEAETASSPAIAPPPITQPDPPSVSPAAPAKIAPSPFTPAPIAEAPPTVEMQKAVPQVHAENRTTARGPFLDKINRFRDWMRHNFSATGIFILDREGAVIFDESNHGRFHFMARNLALASRRPGTPASNVHMKIGAGATLEVIPVETAYGCLVLGAVVSEPLPPPSISAVIEALSQVATPPQDSAR